MTMDIIDKRIYSCNEAICKNIESLQANERGLLSQNILSQLRNFLECVFLKIYVASGNSLIENEYQNIKNAIKFINTLQGKYRFLNQFHKLLQISVSHYTLDPDSSERLMLKYYEYLLRIKTFMKDNYGIELLENLHKFPLNTDTAFTQYYEAIEKVLENKAVIARKTIQHGRFYIENIIDGYSNLNPARKARRNIFLTDEQWENERKALVNRLSVWLKLLRENDTAEQMRDKAKETAENAENLLNHNLKNALARTRELESAYRTIAFFYKNTESDKVKNVTIVNATMEQLQDLDNTIFADHISNELKQNFDRLDLRRNYSLLVVPGYIGSNAILDKWSKMAYENKAFLVTDFQDLETPDDVVDIFFNANHTSGDVFKSNTIMTCNWLLGRQREESVGEEENLYIPPSSSLAGKIYNTLMSQVVAGKKFGGLNEVESVRFDLRKSEISELERMGLVPMVNEYSKVMAFSAKTLFNGDNLGLQTYSVVRVFDYITKVLIDFLNRRAFENWTTRTEADLRGQVVKFLDSVMGPNKLIERFKVMKIEQDPNQKDRVLLDIHITPYFPAKSFVIQLAGHKGDNPEDAIWESEYHQE